MLQKSGLVYHSNHNQIMDYEHTFSLIYSILKNNNLAFNLLIDFSLYKTILACMGLNLLSSGVISAYGYYHSIIDSLAVRHQYF